MLKSTKSRKLCKVIGDVRRNTALFEYDVRITFDCTHPMEVLQVLRKLVNTCHRFDIKEMRAFFMLLFLLKDSALRFFDSTSRVGSYNSFDVDDCT